jgi:hypothetical protein
MSEGWKRLDLEGGGLQAANLRLARQLKRRRRAFALWAAFPLGLHHTYLENPAGAWLCRGLAVLAGVLLFFDWRAALAAVVVLLAVAVYDLFWIDRRVVQLNKRIRREVYLSTASAPPEGYQGRQLGDDGNDAGARRRHGNRVLSFAEQERLLRELASRRDPDRPKQQDE